MRILYVTGTAVLTLGGGGGIDPRGLGGRHAAPRIRRVPLPPSEPDRASGERGRTK